MIYRRTAVSWLHALAAVALLVALFFSCRGLIVGSGFDGSASDMHAACCSVGEEYPAMLLHGQIQTALPVIDALALVFAVYVAILLSRPDANLSSFALRKSVPRDANGAARLFCYFVELFRTGILHPKIY